MRCLIVGATAGLGLAITNELAKGGHKIVASSSDLRDLESLKDSIRVEYSNEIYTICENMNCLDGVLLYEKVKALLGGVDWIFIVAGYSASEDGGQIEQDLFADICSINYTTPASIVNKFLADIILNNGKIIIMGSVASMRPRGANTLYAASKTGLEFYALGLRHYLSKKCKASVTVYRLGYLKTNMTFGKRLPFPAADPKTIAKQIIQDLSKRDGLIYAPFWWKFITIGIQLIPNFIFKKLNI